MCVGRRPGEAAQDAKLRRLRFAPLDAESPRTHLDLGQRNAAAVFAGRQILLDQDEVKVVEINRQDQEKISGEVAESGGKRAGIGERDAGKLEQIDLKKAVIIGDQLDPANSAHEAFG